MDRLHLRVLARRLALASLETDISGDDFLNLCEQEREKVIAELAQLEGTH